MASLYKLSEDTSLFLTPNGNGHVDVKSDYMWTLSKRRSRDDVPGCYLWEYQPNNAQLINALYYWKYQIGKITDIPDFASLNTEKIGTALKSGMDTIGSKGIHISPTELKDPMDVYKYRYAARPTGFSYILPYLGTDRFNVSNTFEPNNFAQSFPGLDKLMGSSYGASLATSNSKTTGASLGRIDILADIVQGGIHGLTDYSINTIETHSWAGTEADSQSITFDLLNTKSVEDAIKNWEFCYLMNYQNHPAQRNAFLSQSPCIYTLFIPNTIYMPVCYIKTFNVINLGQNKMVDGRAMPEAFRITISFQGILNPPSRNMQSALDKGFEKGTSNPELPNPSVIDTSGQQNTGTDAAIKAITDLVPKPTAPSNPNASSVPGQWTQGLTHAITGH